MGRKKTTTTKKKPEKTHAKRARQPVPSGFPGGTAWGVIILARPCWLMNTDGFVWWTPYEGVAKAQANYEGDGHEARPILDSGQPGAAD